MQENNAPALERDMAELIRLQKKQLLHQRIRTALSLLMILAFALLLSRVLPLIPEITELLSAVSETVSSIDPESFDLSTLEDIADSLSEISGRLGQISGIFR